MVLMQFPPFYNENIKEQAYLLGKESFCLFGLFVLEYCKHRMFFPLVAKCIIYLLGMGHPDLNVFTFRTIGYLQLVNSFPNRKGKRMVNYVLSVGWS